MKKWVLFSTLIISIVFFSFTKEKTYEIGQIKTPKGEVLLWLYNETPKHKASFLELAKAGYWDSLSFNRVIPNFVAQGGCPDTPKGFNDSEYLLEPEFHKSLLHEYGALGAGRDDNRDKLSARCQFYIVQNKEGLYRLNGDYTVFGKVIEGMDVINAIVNVPRDSIDQPLISITLDINIIELSKKELEDLNFEIPKV